MAYRCPMAITGGAREAIRCKASGSVCAHQKMCMMEGRVVLTAGAMDCPGRDEVGQAAAHPDIPAGAQMNAEAHGRNIPDASDATEPAAAPDAAPADDPGQAATADSADVPAKKPGRKPAAKKTTAKAGAKRGTGK